MSNAAIDTRSYQERSNNGTTFVGSDVKIFQATMLASNLKMFANTKGRLIPTRGVSGTKMLALATTITQKKYKRVPDFSGHLQAATDLLEYANNLKNLPTNIPDIL